MWLPIDTAHYYHKLKMIDEFNQDSTRFFYCTCLFKTKNMSLTLAHFEMMKYITWLRNMFVNRIIFIKTFLLEIHRVSFGHDSPLFLIIFAPTLSSFFVTKHHDTFNMLLLFVVIDW